MAEASKWLVNVREWATIASLLAVPVVLLAFQSSVQQRIAKQDASRQYVQLAAEILRDPEGNQSKEREQLRTWAVKIIDENAPIPLTEEAKTELIEKGVPSWLPPGYLPEGYLPDGHLSGGFDPRAFSPNSFSPGSFAMGMRRMTEKECRERFSGTDLNRCLEVAAGTK